jgi:hypothetical protein
MQQPAHTLPGLAAARGIKVDGTDVGQVVERLVRYECEKDPAYYSSKSAVWFQVGHVREMTQDYHAAKGVCVCVCVSMCVDPLFMFTGDAVHVLPLQCMVDPATLTVDRHATEAYERVLQDSPKHAKALQQLGWLYHNIPNFSHQPNGTGMGNQEIAVTYLLRSIDANPGDDQAWYLLGRCYMTQKEYTKAHKAVR